MNAAIKTVKLPQLLEKSAKGALRSTKTEDSFSPTEANLPKKSHESFICELKNLAKKFRVPQEDVILIAINSNGANTDLPHDRIRFKLALNGTDKTFYLGLPKKPTSPFYISANEIALSVDGTNIGTALEVENDTCDAIYLRRGRTVLNLNSNSRSRCKGCAFCFDSQTPLDNKRLTAHDAMEEFIETFLKKEAKSDLAHLYQVALVTGCFGSEEATLRHILLVQDVFTKYKFRGELLYFGSQLRSKDSFKKIKDNIQNPALVLSIECFDRRNVLLNKLKSSLTLDGAINLLSLAADNGISATVSYIVGLDSHVSIKAGFEKLDGYFDRFPILNIFQPHKSDQELLRVPGAERLEYYLIARAIFEELFAGKQIKPRTWENYRSLWYFEYAGENLNEQTI
jgi:hypothetical protein